MRGPLVRAALLGATAIASVQSWTAAAQTLPPAGVAQDTPAPTDVQQDTAPADGDIIVTAQKRSERLQDVPLSITAASGDQLGKQNITSAADLGRIATGFSFQQSQYGTPVFSIRGVGFYSEQVANAPTVTLYTDQIPLPYARMTEGASLDVERVEILKGPQGTLFGQNSTGGAINYIAAKPTDTLHGGFALTYGRFNEVDAEAYVSGPITDTLSFRLTGRREYRDPWQTSLTRDDRIGRRDFGVGRLLVDWRPSDRLFVELNVNGWSDRSDVQQSQPRGYLPVSPDAPATPQAVATAAALSTYPYYKGNSNRVADWDPGRDFDRNDRFYQFAGTINYAIDDRFKLISISAYSHLKTFAPVDADGTSYTALFLQQFGAIRTFTQELRLEGQAGPVKFIVGGNYEHDNADEFQSNLLRGSNSQLRLPPPAPTLSFSGLNIYNDQRVSSKSAFGNVDFRITDKLNLQGGIRYTDENRHFVGCLANDGTPTGFGSVLGFPLTAPNQCVTLLPSGVPGQYESDLDQDNISWRAGLNYKPGAGSLLYANVTKGYKSGDFGSLPAVTYQQLAPVVQESVLAYEVGAKTSLFDRRVDLSVAGFYDDYRNKQTQGLVLVQPFGNLPFLINVPKSRVYGAEADLTVRPFRGLRLTGGVTYLNTKVTRTALIASPFGPVIDARGERLPIAPKWQVQGDGEYEFRLGGETSAFVGASVTYRTSTDAQLGAQRGPAGTQDYFRIRSYALLDLRAGVDITPQVRAQVWGRNVTNTGYWTNVTHVYDAYDRLTGMPATYGVTLSTRF